MIQLQIIPCSGKLKITKQMVSSFRFPEVSTQHHWVSWITRQLRQLKHHLTLTVSGSSMCVYVCAQLHPTLCNSMDFSPLIFQARILDWITISSSREPSRPGIEPASPVSPEPAGGFLPSFWTEYKLYQLFALFSSPSAIGQLPLGL